MGWGGFSAGLDQAKMERAVAAASRSFGEGVQNIVVSAKARQGGKKNDGEWKEALLALLGQTTTAAAASPTPPVERKGMFQTVKPETKSDIDILLDNAACDKFVLRCVENELPPNLIHCLRLLRVLELQHAGEAPATASPKKAAKAEKGDGDTNGATAKEDDGNEGSSTEGESSSPAEVKVNPVSQAAAAKVSKLLCLLCTDTSVGEQLRPHLFGLLALSGASYPPTGVHVAAAASDVICQFAAGCLTRNLVWFIHDRKMMVHMTDDVKELSGMTSSPSPSQAVVPMGLSGQEAEKAGLLVIALRTVVKVVHESIRFETIDLVHDFEAAGGYDVIHFAILHATGSHGKELLELLPLLACCPNEVLIDSDGGGTVQKLASNTRVFDMMGDLLTRSNLLLRIERKRIEEEKGSRTFIDLANPDDLRKLAMASVRTAANVRLRTDSEERDVLDVPFDLPSELMSITFQLVADHPNNYEALEGRLHILTYSVLAFPCFNDDDFKNFVLKTIEFVLTAVGVGKEVTPITAFVEILFAMCQTLMRRRIDFGEDSKETLAQDQEEKVLDLIAADADLMGSTLEKLLQFDQRVAPLIIESGVLDANLDSLLTLVSEAAAERKATITSQVGVAPAETLQDKTFGIVCRVLKLLVASQPARFYEPLPEKLEETRLHILLRVAVEEMGVEAAADASGVFEAYLAAFPSLEVLGVNMDFALRILDDLSSRAKEEGLDAPQRASLVQRISIVLSMIRSVLQSKSLARNAFLKCGGFDSLLRVVLSQKNVSTSFDGSNLSNAVLEMMQNVTGLLDAAIGMKTRNPLTANETSPLAIRSDVTVDCVSSQLSFNSASSLNRSHIRQHGFYLNLAAALAGTGLLASEYASSIVDLVLGHVDPEFGSTSDVDNLSTIRNPDAIRLAFGVALFLPDARSGNKVSTQVLDRMLRLCEPDRITTTLPQIASCGLSYSLVNPKEFGSILFDYDHSLQSRFALMLSRVAALNMSYMDFVGILRNIAAPILCADGSDGSVRLPVISSSVKKRATAGLVAVENWSEGFEQREQELSRRLETICEIAKNSHLVASVRVGGDTVNTIAVLMHKVRLDERLKATAEEGRLRFVEVESIDASAAASDSETGGIGGSAAPNSASDRLWTPLAGSGFSYSLWLRHEIPTGTDTAGNIYILDICSVSKEANSGSGQGSSFLSVWYDVPNQRFNVMSSASYRGEPTCFPVSPLIPDEWHHILVTYTPAKRAMIARKSVFAIYVDGRPLEAEVRVESVNLPPTSRVVIGAPNPALAMSGVVRGILPVWELGPTLLFSTVLLDLDATAIYSYGPSFTGLLWGDRPQRLSLAATGTAMFAMLAGTGESGSIASSLRRRDIPKLEHVGYSTMGHTEKDDLATMNLLCNIPPECVVFGFLASTTSSKMRNEALKGERRVGSERLVNLAHLNYGNDAVSSEALVYGNGSVVAPVSFKDCLRWAGGPVVLLPLVNAANTSKTLALTLQLIRLGSKAHRPNLEMLQAGGGYRIMSVILQGKGVVDERCLDQCLAFAIHGFDPDPTETPESEDSFGGPGTLSSVHSHGSTDWVFADLDAMKHLLLNHQVWDLRKFGPRVPLRLLTILNRLVDHKAIHKAFNARRLHQIGIVRWALHLAIEAAELYTGGDLLNKQQQDSERKRPNPWFCDCPRVAEVSVGGDPGNPFLLECKNLLRRVLTFMLTPGDLEALVESIVFTASIGGKSVPLGKEVQLQEEDRMLPGPTMRLHLVRLLEELIVDGVNEIAASKAEGAGSREDAFVPHAGGVASPNQPYFTTSNNRGKTLEGGIHPKHQQAQNFLSAFASFLTPVWFATVLESCQEEASASALLRLMILMLQGSSAFETGFQNAGAFSPFVLSIPKFSTCPGICIAMLSQLLSVPILHLHSLPNLDPEQLCEVFDIEGDATDFNWEDTSSDPSSGIFALLVECVGRNVQHVLCNSDLAPKAANTNQAIVKLLTHRHATSASFREYCCTLSFLEPLSQALCLVYNEKLSPTRMRSRRPSLLADVPKGLTPTERFVGSLDDPDSTGMGIVRLVRLVVSHAVSTGSGAAQIISAIFRSFPIHATPQQVEAFHLVLIEHCCHVVDGVLQRGEGDALALSNCIGVCSVFLDHEVGAFFTSEAALTTVKTTISILDALLRFDTPAIYSLSNAEHSMLTRDAAYIANLACATTLKFSLPHDDHDAGDEDLQSNVLEMMDSSIDSLLLLPSRDRKSNRKVPTGKATKPSAGSKLFDIWESASIARYEADRPAYFPDSFSVPNPNVVTIAPLLVSLGELLHSSRDDVRGLTVSIFVALLQHCSGILSDLLVTEVERNGRTEMIDVVNRGGFKALLAAHEAAVAVADSSSSSLSVKRKYASFFDWFERKQDDVQLVFSDVDKKANEVFPGLRNATRSHAQAVESEQKLMLMKLSSRSSDRTMLGGLERAELAKICEDSTTEIHTHWKRQGFDDLAYGAMKWKVLLRQLKGSCSIWEGGPRIDDKATLSLQDLLSKLEAGQTSLKINVTQELVKRWKLDLTEGFERQRRRLLPNYEFHGLYNLDEEHDVAIVSDTPETLASITEAGNTEFIVGSGQMEATAELLKDLNIKRTNRTEDEDIYEIEDDADTVDTTTEATTISASTPNDQASLAASDDTDGMPNAKQSNQAAVPSEATGEPDGEEKDSSSYELITGLLQAGDWPEKSYNVSRCTGLEVTKALLLWCGDAIYVIDGFEQIGGDGMEGKISRVERERSSFHINLRPKDFKVQSEKTEDELAALKSSSGQSNSKREQSQAKSAHQPEEPMDEVIYEHRSQRILLQDLYSVYRRRYQLQQNALEIYDVHRNSALIAFASHEGREEILAKVLQSSIPNSIFSSSYGTFINYSKFMKNLQAKITAQWQAGKISNFEFLMQLNSFAGRSFNDLTQYPVFPWVIADYDSEEIDLSDPRVYRDLSKPMGAIGEERAQQFRDRYEALASTYFGDDDPPPFHYGTHYSCAAYVLYYLMRLEPFSRLALALQGGRFDVADRLFHDVGRSWRSASSENLQDVRELIPEFFYLPDFFSNTNHFDFGETQRGKTVHDVSLPKWARGDPKRFIRINRQALESEYVSKNLHHWVDLVFGFKQRGDQAVESLNTFVHVTYEGEVDIDSMTDPVQRQSTIAQIQNFGQTPSRLERHPFPSKNVTSALKGESIDFGSLSYLAPLTPPLCVVGAPHRVHVKHFQTDVCKLGLAGQSDTSVGDISFVKGQVMAVGKMCALIVPSKKYYRFGGLNNGVSVHAAAVTARFREVNKLITVHDDLHRAPISTARASPNGNWLVTGCVDSTLRVWAYDESSLKLRATLCGHDGAHIKCIDVSTECGVIVSGCGQGRVLMWDLRTLTFVRPLKHGDCAGEAVVSVSINHKNGNVITLVGSLLSIFNINGSLLAHHRFTGDDLPTCAVSTDCPDWMDKGVVAVTGHESGEVCLWNMDCDTNKLIMRQTVEGNTHSKPITALRVTGVERQDTLLIGDRSGRVSVCKTAQLDGYSVDELAKVVSELSRSNCRV